MRVLTQEGAHALRHDEFGIMVNLDGRSWVVRGPSIQHLEVASQLVTFVREEPLGVLELRNQALSPLVADVRVTFRVSVRGHDVRASAVPTAFLADTESYLIEWSAREGATRLRRVVHGRVRALLARLLELSLVGTAESPGAWRADAQQALQSQLSADEAVLQLQGVVDRTECAGGLVVAATSLSNVVVPAPVYERIHHVRDEARKAVLAFWETRAEQHKARAALASVVLDAVRYLGIELHAEVGREPTVETLLRHLAPERLPG